MTYKTCQDLEDGTFWEHCPIFCPAETFFDETRSLCWEICKPDAAVNCALSKPKCGPAENDPTNTECRGTVWIADKEDCHFYRTCFKDRYTDQKWVVCRQPCPVHNGVLMVFDKKSLTCKSPAISSNATTDDVCTIAMPVPLTNLQEVTSFVSGVTNDIVFECRQARGTLEEEACLQQEFNCKGPVCISSQWADESSCSGFKHCKVTKSKDSIQICEKKCETEQNL